MWIEKRTKIITTIGPSSESSEMMEKLFNAGMTTIRLNFSHGSHKEHARRMALAREVSKKLNKPISIMLDTKGPEIRIGKVKDGSYKVKKGEIITFICDKDKYENEETSNGEFTVAYNMAKDLKVGNIILVDDGKLELETVEIGDSIIKAKAINDHIIKTRKRINLPGVKFSLPFLSEVDKEDIKFGIKNNVDFIAASFTNSAEDVNEIRHILKEHNAEHILIIAKIESQYGVDHFNEIINAADGAMVARGDLGLEVPYYDVPVIQKHLVYKCRDLGKPVIVATQMLDSMENSPTPTRAEVTDVYLATEQGADATMLSGESAAGNFPVEAVEVMSNINSRAEKEFYKFARYKKHIEYVSNTVFTDRDKIAIKVANYCFNGDYKAAIVLSNTGKLLSSVSRFRPNTAIIGVCPDKKQETLFGITSSVFMCILDQDYISLKTNIDAQKEIAMSAGLQKGDKFIVVRNTEINEYEL